MSLVEAINAGKDIDWRVIIDALKLLCPIALGLGLLGISGAIGSRRRSLSHPDAHDVSFDG